MMALRRAATIILAAPCQAKPAESAFQILMMKRSSTMKFMPDVHVFPGGAVDKYDEEVHWKDILPESSISMPHLSFRIAAIRETFEESGILLAQPEDVLPSISLKDLFSWREKVHKDASTFPEMCRNFKIYPDVARLYEWSNWITPHFEAKRFDTKFFLAIIKEVPSFAIHDSTESTTTDWLTPTELLLKNQAREIKVIPPQFYTMTELSSIPDLKELENVAKTKRIFPIQPEFVSRDDGTTVIALPGDTLHPLGGAPSEKHRLIANFDKGFMSMKLEKNVNGPKL